MSNKKHLKCYSYSVVIPLDSWSLKSKVGTIWRHFITYICLSYLEGFLYTKHIFSIMYTCICKVQQVFEFIPAFVTCVFSFSFGRTKIAKLMHYSWLTFMYLCTKHESEICKEIEIYNKFIFLLLIIIRYLSRQTLCKGSKISFENWKISVKEIKLKL